MDYKETLSYLPEIEAEKVSVIARSKGGWLYELIKRKGDFDKMPKHLIEKRRLFLLRTIPAYKKNKTRRRFLSLISWLFLIKK
jgi:hypothetical protein